jgi:class 3 adenylate cyclase
MNTTEPTYESVRLCAVDHGPWLAVQAGLQRSLEAHRLGQLLAPTALILHDVLESAVKVMHLQVFRRIMEADFDVALNDAEGQVESLFNSEVVEHGSQNIAHACRTGGWMIEVGFPQVSAAVPDTLAHIDVPFRWDPGLCNTPMLIEALGYRLEVEPLGEGSRISLSKRTDRAPVFRSPALLDAEAQLASVGHVAQQLSYGLIHFSAVGEITAVSPSMLALLRLDPGQASAQSLAQAVPVAFLNDIIWGLALAEGNGAFENYRIRVRLPGDNQVSVLFNVSGFRQIDGAVISLWQTVSLDAGGAQLTEGSILSEVRIHNITRNYVPQLVEQKARDAVRLGQTTLRNEERPVAVLFCDIVGFTSYVELNAGSESTIDTLNTILRRVSASVKRNHGFIDKFMGDCAMAIFDAPSNALLAAIDMQSHSEDINTLRSRAGQQTLKLRIGIHWGEVVIGNVGTAERLDWTAIGDVVNTASRIEKSCEPGSVLISREVRATVEKEFPDRFSFHPVFGIKVKGKLDELAVCHLDIGDKGSGGT